MPLLSTLLSLSHFELQLSLFGPILAVASLFVLISISNAYFADFYLFFLLSLDESDIDFVLRNCKRQGFFLFIFNFLFQYLRMNLHS